MTTYATSSTLDARLGLTGRAALADEAALAAASRRIDMHCRRRFTADQTTSARLYVPADAVDLHVDDIATSTGLTIEIDFDRDGTFATDYTPGTDVQLEPLNGVVDAIEGHPITRLVALAPMAWPVDHGGRALVRVTAKWGWAAIPETIASVCADLAARLLVSDPTVASEQIGGYQVQYRAAAIELTDADVAALEPFRRCT